MTNTEIKARFFKLTPFQRLKILIYMRAIPKEYNYLLNHTTESLALDGIFKANRGYEIENLINEILK